MCMIFECDIEKKQEIGWKVIEKFNDFYKTPYQGERIEKGKTYFASNNKEEGIYIFLKKEEAEEFKRWSCEIFGSFFLIAKVRLGNHIWKGKINPNDSFNGLELEFFYSTDKIEVLDIEEIS